MVLILIPPSEGKHTGGSGKPITPTPAEKVMIERLMSYRGDLGKLLGVKDKALNAAKKVNKSLLTSPTMPAIERYKGVVYTALDYDTLTKKQQNYFHKHMRIVSAMFGMIAPDKMIPDYKLKIDKLNAVAHWKPLIEKQVQDTYVLDLLPQAHAKAVPYKQGQRIDFIIEKNGKQKPAGHHGKFIKGRFLRWLCENHITDMQHITQFSEDGFAWNGQAFVKKE